MYSPYVAHHDRDRLLVAAVWLISLGSVFLVQQLSDWSWGEAWPLFVIFVGVGSAGSTLVNRRSWSNALWAIWWPIAVIAVGVLLLASTTGAIDVAPAELIALWPVALLAVGVWFLIGAFVAPGQVHDTLAIPLAGATSANVGVRFGGGEMTVHPAEPGMLVSGHFEGGVEERTKGPGQIELRPPSGTLPVLWDRPLRWQVGLSAEVPVDISLDTGASRSTIDLSDLRIRNLQLKTGASETRVRVPTTGVTSMRVNAGMAAVHIEVPEGVAARIRSRVAIGTTSVNEARFPRAYDGFASPDFDSAPNRVEIDVEGGFGVITIR